MRNEDGLPSVKYLTTAGAAKLLAYSASNILKLINKGQLRSIREGNRHLIDERWIEEYRAMQNGGYKTLETPPGGDDLGVACEANKVIAPGQDGEEEGAWGNQTPSVKPHEPTSAPSNLAPPDNGQWLIVSAACDDLAHAWFLGRHLDDLIHAADEARQYLHNPSLAQWKKNAGIVFPEGEDNLWEFPLMLRGHDWALEPTRWAGLTTPDFTDLTSWPVGLKHLLEHLAGSPFLEGLREFRKEAARLGTRVWLADQPYRLPDPRFLEALVGSCYSEVWATEPYANNPAERQLMLKHERPSVSNETVARECARLANGPLPDIYAKLWELLERLNRLNLDFSPASVRKAIASTMCEECAPFRR